MGHIIIVYLENKLIADVFLKIIYYMDYKPKWIK